MPSPINPYNLESNTIVYLKYDSQITKITSKKNDVFALGPNTNADELLASFFEKYPQVFKKAVPGTLLHKINGAFAEPSQKLQTGDFVELGLISVASLRKQIKKEIDELTSELKLNFSSKDVASFVFEDTSDTPDKLLNTFLPHNTSDTFSEEQLFIIEGALVRAWSSLPQKRHGGKSQMQILHKELLKDFVAQKNLPKNTTTKN